MAKRNDFRKFSLLAAGVLVGMVGSADAETVIQVSGGGNALVEARNSNAVDDAVFEIQDSLVYTGSFWFNRRFHIRALPGQTPTIVGDGTMSSAVIYCDRESAGGSIGSNDGGTITIRQGGSSDWYHLTFEAIGTGGSGTVLADGQPLTVENVILDGTGLADDHSRRLVWIQNWDGEIPPYAGFPDTARAKFNNVVFDRKNNRGWGVNIIDFYPLLKLEFEFNNCTFVDVGPTGAAFYTNGSWGELTFNRCRFDLGPESRGLYLGLLPALMTEQRFWTLNMTECWLQTENGQGIRLGGSFSENGDYTQVNLLRCAIVDEGVTSGSNIVIGPFTENAEVNIVHSDFIRGGDQVEESFPQNILIDEFATSEVSVMDSNVIGYSNLINGLDDPEPFFSGVGVSDYTLLLTPPDQPGTAVNWDLGTSMVSGGEAPGYGDVAGGDFRYTNVNQTASSTGTVLGSNFNFVTFEYGGDVTPPGDLGDINSDGVINVADVTELATLIAAGTPPDNEVGDINNDGSVNEQDVQALAESIVD